MEEGDGLARWRLARVSQRHPWLGMAGRNMSEITMLVVDHHDLFRVGLASMLAGAEDIDVVGQASSGGGAVRLAAELHPNVVL